MSGFHFHNKYVFFWQVEDILALGVCVEQTKLLTVTSLDECESFVRRVELLQPCLDRAFSQKYSVLCGPGCLQHLNSIRWVQVSRCREEKGFLGSFLTSSAVSGHCGTGCWLSRLLSSTSSVKLNGVIRGWETWLSNTVTFTWAYVKICFWFHKQPEHIYSFCCVIIAPV